MTYVKGRTPGQLWQKKYFFGDCCISKFAKIILKRPTLVVTANGAVLTAGFGLVTADFGVVAGGFALVTGGFFLVVVGFGVVAAGVVSSTKIGKQCESIQSAVKLYTLYKLQFRILSPDFVCNEGIQNDLKS